MAAKISKKTTSKVASKVAINAQSIDATEADISSNAAINALLIAALEQSLEPTDEIVSSVVMELEQAQAPIVQAATFPLAQWQSSVKSLIADASFKAENRKAIAKFLDLIERSKQAQDVLTACSITDKDYCAVRNIKAYQRINTLITALAMSQSGYLDSNLQALFTVHFKHSDKTMTLSNQDLKAIRSSDCRTEDTAVYLRDSKSFKSASTASAQMSANTKSALALFSIIQPRTMRQNGLTFNSDSYAYNALKALYTQA